MLRAIALALALMIGMGVIIPLTTDYTQAGAHKKSKKKHAKYKKYSKKWWRAYYQRKNRKSALAKRKRAMRVQQILLARNTDLNQANDASEKSKNKVSKTDKVAEVPAVLPSGEAAPKGWKSNLASNSELQFRVDDDNGSQIGSASISVVGSSVNQEGTTNTRNKTVGGVSINALRSTVIDRMIKENGWVINDYQKEIGGKKVYVVVAQSEAAGGAIQSRMFYFTEVDGRIYSVATSATSNSSERIVQESEKVIDSLQRKKENPQQAAIK
jgi:hypothetical protein